MFVVFVVNELVVVFQAVNCKGQHSISYTLSRNHTVVVEYCHDKDTDMFQVPARLLTLFQLVVLCFFLFFCFLLFFFFSSAADRAIHREPHRLRGDGHSGGRPGGGGGDPHHAEHHLPLRLPSRLRARPALHGAHLRCGFRLLQKHLPRGECRTLIP